VPKNDTLVAIVIEMDLEGVCSHIMYAYAYGELMNKRRLADWK